MPMRQRGRLPGQSIMYLPVLSPSLPNHWTGNHQVVAGGLQLPLQSGDKKRMEIHRYTGHDEPDDVGAAIAERGCHAVVAVPHFLGHRFYALSRSLADPRVVVERPGYSGWRYPQCLGDVYNTIFRFRLLRCHLLSSAYCQSNAILMGNANVVQYLGTDYLSSRYS